MNPKRETIRMCESFAIFLFLASLSRSMRLGLVRLRRGIGIECLIAILIIFGDFDGGEQKEQEEEEESEVGEWD